eukprot:jgi/Chlat1/6363/Chrsp44S05752
MGSDGHSSDSDGLSAVGIGAALNTDDPELAKLQHALNRLNHTFAVSNPRMADNPIVFASGGFFKLTGYEPHEVIGRNCRFLQGPETDRRAVLEIRDAIREERACQVRILNYRKDGRKFWNLFHMSAVYDTQGKVLFFVGVQTDLSPLCKQVGHQGVAFAFAAIDSHRLSTFHSLEHEPEPEPEAQHGFGTAPSGSAEDLNFPAAPTAPEAIGAQTGDMAAATSDRVVHSISHVEEELAREGLRKPVTVPSVSSSLLLSLTRIQQSFVLSDPNLNDCPIIHASDVFCRMSGYSREEVVGRNCRFLQGPGTDPQEVAKLREAVKAAKPCTVRLLNYRKNGASFWNHLHIAPVRSSDGKVAFYVGVQLDVSDYVSELEGRAMDEGSSSGALCSEVDRLKQLGCVGQVRVAVRALKNGELRRCDYTSTL